MHSLFLIGTCTCTCNVHCLEQQSNNQYQPIRFEVISGPSPLYSDIQIPSNDDVQRILQETNIKFLQTLNADQVREMKCTMWFGLSDPLTTMFLNGNVIFHM